MGSVVGVGSAVLGRVVGSPSCRLSTGVAAVVAEAVPGMTPSLSHLVHVASKSLSVAALWLERQKSRTIS